MRFGLALELSNVDLLNIDSLDTDIPSKYFACLHNVFEASSRHVLKTSSRRLQDQQMFAGISPCSGKVKVFPMTLT